MRCTEKSCRFCNYDEAEHEHEVQSMIDPLNITYRQRRHISVDLILEHVAELKMARYRALILFVTFGLLTLIALRISLVFPFYGAVPCLSVVTLGSPALWQLREAIYLRRRIQRYELPAARVHR